MSSYTVRDLETLKPIIEKAAEICRSNETKIKIERWKNVNKHNKPDSPPVYTLLDESAWKEVLPDKLLCETDEARNIEKMFKKLFYLYETGDDTPIYDTIYVNAIMDVTPKNIWGVDVKMIKPSEKNGAWKFDHPIKNYEDLNKLIIPEFKYNKAATEERVEKIAGLVGGHFKVEVSSDHWQSALLNRHVGELRGIMEIMYDMVDAPEFVHNLIEYFMNAHLSLMKAEEAAGIVTPGPHNPWYDAETFGPDPVDGKYTFKNRWLRIHGQEFDQVSPEMCEEFLFPYQRILADKYGKVEYGCCENLTRKIDSVLTIPNLAMVICSPYSNLETIAGAVEDKAVIQWRMRPVDLLFDDDLPKITKTVKDGLKVLKNNHFHIALREIMTLNRRPERLKEFIDMARSLAADIL